MKKQIIPKNGRSLACLTVVAVMTAAQALMAQAQQTIDDNSDHVLRLLAHDEAVNINVTPSGINSESEGSAIHTVTMSKGSVLTIHGTVDESIASDPNNPDANAKLDYVELTLGKKNTYYNIVSHTTSDRNRTVRINGDKLNNNTFDFYLTGDNNGQQRVTIKAVWTVNGEKRQLPKYPIMITVN